MNRNGLPGRKMLMFMGLALVILGALLLVSPAAVGSAVVRLVAFVLVVTGIVQLVQGLRGGTGVHTIVSSVLGLAVAGLGVAVWFNPMLGSGFLTALLMIFFVVNGLWKISTGIRYRQLNGWSWFLLSGLVSLVFVYFLWAQWPLAGAWAVGVLVGLDLLLTGLSMIVVAAAMKKIRSSDYFDTINL
ncbi:HdeD family acid-resistance protein [Pseudomonadota bacterium]|jgi:uncharacterized membrane protein HdeD (DUF308 family)